MEREASPVSDADLGLPEGSEERALARQAYDQVLDVDGSIEALVAEWQALVRGTSEIYTPEEWKLVDRATAVDERVAPALLRLGSAVPRFSTYRSRLRAALAHVEEGERQWFDGSECDSYRTVWNQLGEDLRAALGLD
jgi:hypothetical protein